MKIKLRTESQLRKLRPQISSQINLKVKQEKPLKIYYDNQEVGDFFIDLFAENTIIVELKSAENLSKAHACPVKLRSTVHEVNLFNLGGSAHQLSERHKERDWPLNQLRSNWR